MRMRGLEILDIKWTFRYYSIFADVIFFLMISENVGTYLIILHCSLLCRFLSLWVNVRVRTILTYSFPMHPFSTPWKRQKTVRFSNVFKEYRKGASGTNVLNSKISFIFDISTNLSVTASTLECQILPHTHYYVCLSDEFFSRLRRC